MDFGVGGPSQATETIGNSTIYSQVTVSTTLREREGRSGV